MNERRKLALRKESLAELTGHELHGVAGAYRPDSLGCIIETIVTCGSYTVATCTCPTGASCVCPTATCGCV